VHAAALDADEPGQLVAGIPQDALAQRGHVFHFHAPGDALAGQDAGLFVRSALAGHPLRERRHGRAHRERHAQRRREQRRLPGYRLVERLPADDPLDPAQQRHDQFGQIQSAGQDGPDIDEIGTR
jgi:hypothetical protein